MDKHLKRNEYSEKKIDYKMKDSGDSKKSYQREGNMKVVYLERGDSGERKIQTPNKKSEKMRLNNDKTKLSNEDPKSKFFIYSTAKKDMQRKNNYQELVKSYSEIRKRIRDKYTFKYNVPVNKSENLSLYKSSKGGTITLNTDGINRPITIRVPTDPSRPAKNPAKPLPEETPRINEKQNPPSGQSDLVVVEKPDSIPEIIQKIPEKPEKIPENPEKIPAKPEKIPSKPEKIIPRPRWKINSPKKRKPIIKTVVSKTDAARIFKAVTFVDDINSTPLEIKIPGENNIIKKIQKVSKFTETTPLKKIKSKPRLDFIPIVRTVRSKPSKESIKMEAKPTFTTVVRKRSAERRRRRWCRNSSSESPVEPACPPTEVARWIPQSVDPQTKPYYDAWLDTTLTATSKHTKKSKSLYDYHMRLLKNFKKALEERPPSPDLFYDKFADERYAGRIRIRQTDRHGRA